jgi:hypothetical protein
MIKVAKKKAVKKGRPLGVEILTVLFFLVGAVLVLYGIFWPTTIIVGWTSLIIGLILFGIAYEIWRKCKK